MASRPEAAYAAAEVTPKWVLISWHHLLPPPLIITAVRAPTQCLCYGSSVRTMRTSLAVALALVASVPAALVHFGALPGVPVPIATLFYGLAIVGASFAMAWGAEAA